MFLCGNDNIDDNDNNSSDNNGDNTINYSRGDDVVSSIKERIIVKCWNFVFLKLKTKFTIFFLEFKNNVKVFYKLFKNHFNF